MNDVIIFNRRRKFVIQSLPIGFELDEKLILERENQIEQNKRKKKLFAQKTMPELLYTELGNK